MQNFSQFPSFRNQFKTTYENAKTRQKQVAQFRLVWFTVKKKLF